MDWILCMFVLGKDRGPMQNYCMQVLLFKTGTGQLTWKIFISEIRHFLGWWLNMDMLAKCYTSKSLTGPAKLSRPLVCNGPTRIAALSAQVHPLYIITLFHVSQIYLKSRTSHEYMKCTPYKVTHLQYPWIAMLTKWWKVLVSSFVKVAK